MNAEQTVTVKTEVIVNIFTWTELADAYIGILGGCLFAYMIFVLVLRSVGGDD